MACVYRAEQWAGELRIWSNIKVKLSTCLLSKCGEVSKLLCVTERTDVFHLTQRSCRQAIGDSGDSIDRDTRCPADVHGRTDRSFTCLTNSNRGGSTPCGITSIREHTGSRRFRASPHAFVWVIPQLRQQASCRIVLPIQRREQRAKGVEANSS